MRYLFIVNKIRLALALLLAMCLSVPLGAQDGWSQNAGGRVEPNSAMPLTEEEYKAMQTVFETMRLREIEAQGAVARFEAARNAYLASIYKLLSDKGLKSFEYELSQDLKSFVRKVNKIETPSKDVKD